MVVPNPVRAAARALFLSIRAMSPPVYRASLQRDSFGLNRR
jgi:hypothetical protein